MIDLIKEYIAEVNMAEIIIGTIFSFILSNFAKWAKKLPEKAPKIKEIISKRLFFKLSINFSFLGLLIPIVYAFFKLFNLFDFNASQAVTQNQLFIIVFYIIYLIGWLIFCFYQISTIQSLKHRNLNSRVSNDLKLLKLKIEFIETSLIAYIRLNEIDLNAYKRFNEFDKILSEKIRQLKADIKELQSKNSEKK